MLKEMTEEIRKKINDRADKVSDNEVLELIEEYVLQDQRMSMSGNSARRKLISGVYNATRSELDILQPLADCKDINEIMVNGVQAVFVEKAGRLERSDVTFDNVEQLEEIIRRIAGKVHREINEMNPIVDARLEDGSRISAICKNIALNGPILTIRRFPSQRITMDDLVDCGTITREAADFARRLVVAGYNIFISGGTSSGKTTFLNVLSNFIPKEERVIVIEDSAELQLTEIENIVRMETKNANAHGKGEVTVRQLIKASLRMRPDRIIVGEVRGEEAIDMLQAMSTGHDGSISTGHANSPASMLSRLEAMALTGCAYPIEAIRSQILSAIDIIVHLGRLSDRSRKVLEITELSGMEDGRIKLNPLFRYRFDGPDEPGNGGALVSTGNALVNKLKMEMRGMPG